MRNLGKLAVLGITALGLALAGLIANLSVGNKPLLGLDLQGGSQIVLEVDRNDLMRSMSQGLRDDVRGALRGFGHARELQHRFDMRNVLAPQLGHLGRRINVISLIG